MLKNETLSSLILDTLIGAVIFFAIVSGGTYYIQSSLIVFKAYGAYNHWAVVLIGVPVLAGLAVRQARIAYPLFSTLLGALASAALLYPLYGNLWAVPPTVTDVLIYVAVILGIGFIATQPLRTTFMIAFKIGRFSVPSFKSGQGKNTTKSAKGKKPVQKTAMTNTQRLQTSAHGNYIAMLELVVGLTSLGLSIFSVFFLGGG